MATIPVVVVLCAIFIAELTTVATTTAIPPAFHQGPQYTINCLETGVVEVKGMPTPTSLQVIGGPSICSGANSTFHGNGGKIEIPKDCLSSVKFEEERSVTFTIHDSTFDGKSTVTPSSVLGLKGGQNLHTITVHCKPLSDSGMNVYVVHGVGLATPEPIIRTELEKVEMRLKSEKYDSYKDVTELPDVSTVYIGDKFYMYLVYLGKDQYSVIPTECKAFEGAYASEPSVNKLDLYTKSRFSIAMNMTTNGHEYFMSQQWYKFASCISKNARDYRVMHPFRRSDNREKRMVSAEMYGFMFNSDKEITFVCTVNICNGGSACKLAKCNGTDEDWSSSRRRRDSATGNKQFTITKRLRVQRKLVQNSAGFIKSSCFCMILLQLFTRMW